MKKFFLAIVPVLICIPVLAQMEIDRNDHYLLFQKNPARGFPDTVTHIVNLYGGVDINSNAITNAFFNKFIFGGYIDDGLKDQVSARLRQNNRLGYNVDGNLNYTAFWEDKIYFASIIQKTHANAGFTKDVFELGFRGNKDFEGQTAVLSPSSHYMFDYQGIQAGFGKRMEEKNLMIGGGVSILRGGRFRKVILDRANLYTAPFGEYLDLDADMRIAFTDQTDGFFPTSNGIGTALNFILSKSIGEKSIFNFEIRDLGFIRWNNLNYYSADTSIRYEGQYIENVLGIENGFNEFFLLDSISENLPLNKERRGLTYLLPASLHANFVYHLNENLTLVGGIKYLINANFFPRIYIKPVYYMTNTFILNSTLAYGGFGRADVEIGLSKKFRKGFIAGLNVFYIESLILPAATSGQGFNVSLSKFY